MKRKILDWLSDAKEESRDLARQAVAKWTLEQPTSAEAWRMAALVYDQEGSKIKAFTAVEKAIVLDVGSPSLHLHRGQILFDLSGKTEKALLSASLASFESATKVAERAEKAYREPAILSQAFVLSVLGEKERALEALGNCADETRAWVGGPVLAKTLRESLV